MLTRKSEDGGFTLVEMSIVLLILGVIGAIATSSVIQSMKTTDRGQKRVFGLADVQNAVERMSREIRAADPVETSSSSSSVSVRVHRNGRCQRYTYALVGTELRQTLERLSPDPGVFNECTSVVAGSTVTTVLVRGLTNGSTTPLFTYLADTAPATTAATTPAAVRSVVIDARSGMSGTTPLQVRTSVQIRNFDTSRYRSQ